MKFSERWLREWVNPPIGTEELVKQLTLAGLEVGSAEPVAKPFSGVLVAEVQAVERHPNADKLTVCRVNIGQPEALPIVCGAANVRAGLRTPLATVGAKLPGGQAIKRSALRGVESQGMLCSAVELGLAESSDGLWELPADTAIGAELWELLELDDCALELELTPNRGDCLSVLGVAREVAALNRCGLQGPKLEPVPAMHAETREVELIAPEACPRYAGRVVRGINPAAETPLWMKERLRRSELRAIHPVVDITNYVLLELGQPMHAFDLDKLSGGISVRYAQAGEQLELLDGQTVTLVPETLVIADQSRAVALAGIMGGAATAVSAETRNIFFESAFFSPQALVGKARSYRLQTDSSYRFERGVDYTQQVRAVERATELLLAICRGEPGPVVERTAAEHLPTRQPIVLRAARIKRLLGVEFSAEEIADTLAGLGMEITPAEPGTWRVIPPAHRFDISIEADLIEELARLRDYAEIPDQFPRNSLKMLEKPEGRVSVRRMCEALVQRGYQEVITYSFVDPALQALLEPEARPLSLLNPIASDLAQMRVSLWPGLLGVLLHNRRRQHERLRLFETGLRFVEHEGQLDQRPVLGGAVCGPLLPEQWGAPEHETDLFDLKGDIEALLALKGQGATAEFAPATHPALHPGQTVDVAIGGKIVGLFGLLHPALAQKLDLDGRVALFQFELAPLAEACVPKFREISRFPSVRRDLSVIVKRDLAVAGLLDCAGRARPETLKDLQLFDVYEGEGIDSSEKSVSLRLTFQASSRTLMDNEVETVTKAILARLVNELGARLRS